MKGLGYFMHYVHKFINIIKMGLICTVVSFVILNGSLSSPNYGQQELNLKSSLLISIGLGASIRMVKFERKKVNNYT
ncbi:MAG: hypothetical protein K0S01_2852 [Herbinix sp.]|jgi:hypothetical protein|nr:hypothetical protein [Herbinix sp.]